MSDANQTVTRAGAIAARLPLRLAGEERLAQLAARGEARAFEAIFRRYHQELYRYCRAILGNAQDAQDALQSTMHMALRTLPRQERLGSLRGWLYRVAHNEAISLLRRRVTPADPESLPDRPCPGADLEAEDRERLDQLVADVAALPERQRGALVMRELSGLSYGQIAMALGSSEGAARQAVFEAREALRELESGRAMQCEEARRAISHGDGRILRARRLRAHLKACSDCRDFDAAIARRRADFALVAPPLAPLAAAGVFATALGGGNGAAATGSSALGGGGAALGGGGGAALGGGGAAAGAALKAASVISALALGAGAADLSGVADLPSLGGGEVATGGGGGATHSVGSSGRGEAKPGGAIRGSDPRRAGDPGSPRPAAERSAGSGAARESGANEGPAEAAAPAAAAEAPSDAAPDTTEVPVTEPAVETTEESVPPTATTGEEDEETPASPTKPTTSSGGGEAASPPAASHGLETARAAASSSAHVPTSSEAVTDGS